MTDSLPEDLTPAIQPEAASQALSARAKVEIESRITQAINRPRDPEAAFQRALVAAKRPAFAEGAIFKIPRGNKILTGPSVKLIRAIKTVWGNIHTQRYVYPCQPGYIHIEVSATDYESNTTETAQDLFRATIFRKGRYGDPDKTIDLTTCTEGFVEGELRNLMARRFAFVEREAVGKIIPFDLVEDVMNACRKTTHDVARGDLKASPEQTRRNLASAFSELSVSIAMIERWLGYGLDEISADKLAELRDIYQSMKSGETKRSEHFEVAVHRSRVAERLEEELAEPEPTPPIEVDEHGQAILFDDSEEHEPPTQTGEL